MSGPFKMKGHTLPGVNQKESEKKKAAYVKASAEHEGKPGFNEARDKAFGGKTTVKGGISTTRKTVTDKEKSKKTT